MTVGVTSNPGTESHNPASVGFWALVAEDFASHDRDIFAQGFWALFWHRFGNWRMSVRPRVPRLPLSLVYKVMHKMTQWVSGIDLPYTVIVGRRVRFEHFGGMILIADQIGDDVIIRQNTTLGIVSADRPFDRPVIENGVELGAGAVIVGDVYVGAGARVGASAVVISNVPRGARIGGVPARLLSNSAEKTKYYG